MATTSSSGVKVRLETFKFKIPAGVSIEDVDFNEAGLNSMAIRALAIDYFLAPTKGESDHVAFAVLVTGTYATKNIGRLHRVVGTVAEKMGVSTQVQDLVSRIQAGARNKEVVFTVVRLASAFPEMGFFGQCLSNPYQTGEFPIDGTALTAMVPTALMFPQALQLDLDDTCQKIADYYNEYYWLRVVNSRSEVPDGPHFNFEYYNTTRNDKYRLRVPIEMMKVENTPDGSSKVNHIEVSHPLSIKAILKYQLAVRHFMKDPTKNSMTQADYDKFTKVEFVPGDKDSTPDAMSQKIMATLITEPFRALPGPRADKRRDGKPILVNSGTDEYKEARDKALQDKAEQNSLLGRRARGNVSRRN